MVCSMTYDPYDYDDDEILYPAWMEEDLYDEYRDRHEEAYNEMLMNGVDL